MGAIPPSDEWKCVHNGKRKRSSGLFLSRKTLLLAFKVLSLAVRFIRLLKDLFDGV